VSRCAAEGQARCTDDEDSGQGLEGRGTVIHSWSQGIGLSGQESERRAIRGALLKNSASLMPKE
jgi:hypothetical protein